MSPGAFRALPEDEQAEMVEYVRQVCPLCGNLRSVCSDPDIDWHPQLSTCWATASVEWGVRRLQKRYADLEPGTAALHPLDGASVYASRVDFGDGEFELD